MCRAINLDYCIGYHFWIQILHLLVYMDILTRKSKLFEGYKTESVLSVARCGFPKLGLHWLLYHQLKKKLAFRPKSWLFRPKRWLNRWKIPFQQAHHLYNKIYHTPNENKSESVSDIHYTVANSSLSSFLRRMCWENKHIGKGRIVKISVLGDYGEEHKPEPISAKFVTCKAEEKFVEFIAPPLCCPFHHYAACDNNMEHLPLLCSPGCKYRALAVIM